MTTRDLVLIALFAAVIAALGLMPPIPLAFIPVPITLQTLGVMLAGLCAGPVRGGLACVLLLVLVALGLPLLAGGRGGLGVFAGASAGFLFAWPVGAVVTGWIAKAGFTAPANVTRNLITGLVAAVTGGIVIVYAGGIGWLALVAGVPFDKAAMGSLAFVPGDLIKAAVAAVVAARVHRAYPLTLR